jgi:adenine-specific DNA-methyltransferase
VKYPQHRPRSPARLAGDEQDWSDLVVHAPPLYIQEKVQPKVSLMICCALRKRRSTRPG